MAFDTSRIRQYIPNGDGYNSEFANDLYECANEIDRLINIATQAHDRLLRGHNDLEIMKILESAWNNCDHNCDHSPKNTTL